MNSKLVNFPIHFIRLFHKSLYKLLSNIQYTITLLNIGMDIHPTNSFNFFIFLLNISNLKEFIYLPYFKHKFFYVDTKLPHRRVPIHHKIRSLFVLVNTHVRIYLYFFVYFVVYGYTFTYNVHT